MQALNRNFDIAGDAEITIEVNPGTLLQNKLHIYRAAGINRLSIGLQSADNQELKDLGRIHTFEEFLKSYQCARMAGLRQRERGPDEQHSGPDTGEPGRIP